MGGHLRGVMGEKERVESVTGVWEEDGVGGGSAHSEWCIR